VPIFLALMVPYVGIRTEQHTNVFVPQDSVVLPAKMLVSI
jgi:hypothetical protein